jgi:cellulose synthase operon protein YhjU
MSQAAEQMPEAVTSVPARKFRTPLANLSLGMWGFYFAAKLALYWKELIGFHSLANIAFAAFVLFPVKHAFWNKAKLVASVLSALALLYYDSWLPPIGRVLSQASLVSNFSSTYLIELAGRFVNLPVIAMLAGIGAAYWVVLRWIRLDVIVLSVMALAPLAPVSRSFVVPQAVEQAGHFAQFEATDQTWLSEQGAVSTPPAIPVQPARQALPLQAEPIARAAAPVPPTQDNELPASNDTGTNPDLDKVFQDFLAKESSRSVSFSAPSASVAPFDIIFIHVCSLSWDDVRAVGLEHHPLWQRFDILLTRFNTVSAYSGPAAIRMLRATCGQTAHTNLYSPASDKCYLMDSLKRIGYEPALAMNHDGHFDQFLKTIQTQGHLDVPAFPLNGTKIAQYAFDDSPVHDDLSVLTHWVESRQQSNAPRVALFYNTASLHDGNHLTGELSKLSSRENFKIRLEKFLDDMEAFLHSMEKSGRRTVVAMVPEHGAALRGDKMQIAGLREIPSPSITLAPVGIRVIGSGLHRAGRTLQIEKPTSYLAVSHIIARLLEKPPYANTTFAPSDYVAGLPVTPFVSQNDEAVMIGHKQRYYLRQDASEWLDYTDF